MLNLAIVALLSGSLFAGTPDGDKDKSTTQAPDAKVTDTATPVLDDPTDVRSITNDSYAFGRPSDVAPIKLWVEYGYGEAEGAWDANGNDAEFDLTGPIGAGASGDIVSQRLAVGAQLNVINFPAFKLGAGGELSVGQNKFQAGSDNMITGDLESSFGLQNVKVFGSLRGRVVGLHGGYIFDLADEVTDPATEFPLSDQRDALFFGADFDYPSERFRLFGGIDYFALEDGADDPAVQGDNILLWNAGLGLRFGFVELGAALMIRTVLVQGTAVGLIANSSNSGGHAGTIAPYLKLSPPSLPVSLFVKGAVLNEYTDYGYAIGGGNDIKPSIGATAGLTIGFD